jgi:hypothetical protein
MCEFRVYLKLPLGDYRELYTFVRRHLVVVVDNAACVCWKGSRDQSLFGN